MAATTSSRTNAPSQQGMGSTQTVTIAQTQTTTRIQPVLHLRGEETRTGTGTRRRIQWADDVVDNEGLGRKSSKVCCIYHAPKGIDESSDESSSDSSDSDSDSEVDDGSARPVGGNKKKGGDKGKDCGHGHDHGKGNGKGKGKARARSPNAYEKVPVPKPKGSGVEQRS